MVGLWAEREVPKMSKDQMKHFSVVLDLVSMPGCYYTIWFGFHLIINHDFIHALPHQENPDLFKWLTGQMAPPDDVSSNPAFVVRAD